MINKLKFFFEVRWIYALLVSLIPVFICFFLARNNNVLVGSFALFIMLVGSVSINLAINLFREFNAFKNGKEEKSVLWSTFFFKDDTVEPKKVIFSLIVLWVIAISVLIYFILYSSLNLLWFVLLGLFVWQLNLPKNNIVKQSKYKELLILLMFGPLLFLAIYYAFSAEFSGMIFLFSFMFGSLVMAIATSTYLQDINKKSLETIIKAKRRYYVAVFFPYVLLVLLVILTKNYFPLLIVFLSGFRVYKLIAKTFFDNYLEINNETIVLQQIFSVLIFIGLLIEHLIK